MPQLDVNTFWYQYIGIVTTLIVVYMLLSYVALPILLRVLVYRDTFLKTQQSTTELAVLSSSVHTPVLSLKETNTSFDGVLTTSAQALASKLSALLTFVKATAVETSNTVSRINLSTKSAGLSALALAYLVLFLVIDEQEN